MNTAKILIVEDQRALWLPIQVALEARNYNVQWATSATEALKILRKNKFKFDVLVLDLMVPLHNVGEITEFPSGGDSRRGGLILYSQILSEKKEGLPTIIMTVVTDTSIRKTANGFAHEVFTKPVSLKDLLSAIERVIQSGKILNQLKKQTNKSRTAPKGGK